MPANLEEVRRAFEEAFDDVRVDKLVEDPINHRIVGTVVWKGFRSMDVHARNAEIRKLVRERLGLRGLNIGFIYPLAPGESE